MIQTESFSLNRIQHADFVKTHCSATNISSLPQFSRTEGRPSVRNMSAAEKHQVDANDPADDDDEAGASSSKRLRTFNPKHSLDSDEEDDKHVEERKNRMRPEDIEGEEETTLLQEGKTQITPFNMKDELEDGHFDRDGNFIFDRQGKKSEEMRDAWLDNIDWSDIRKSSKEEKAAAENDSDDDDSVMQPDALIELYKGMLSLMCSGESVAKSIRRLGSAASKADVEKLTGFADRLVGEGHYDLYEWTHEKIAYELKTLEEKARPVLPNDDMFGEEFTASREVESTKTASSEDEVRWEYKWENTAEATLYGPFSSTQMQQWADAGNFSAIAWVRKSGSEPDTPFYSSTRLDFSLYT